MEPIVGGVIGARMLRETDLLRQMASRCRAIAPTRLTEEGQSVLLRMADDYDRRAEQCLAGPEPLSSLSRSPA